ncbi:diguanylate cyclase (GGDEF)-like protein [Desulfobaculum xiamenense]|uniref:diguanylate cyclase n=1 Tax=Desulfobaculum xiamenense TaxID=995050 RepID=A0A846QMT2_9BACT|nr:GGDEF domain-containing protein [Desulfobaculum xiamenense]NJB66735.1 diguanylate cyclase (GGDEF)-like protein [Desulfobaculum xiamenense]
MPKNNTDQTPHIEHDPLVRELNSLRKLVLESHSDLNGCEDDAGILGILRLCPGLSLEQWPELAEEYGLREWLALPMENGEYPFLRQLQRTLEDLAYQTEHDPLTSLFNRRAFERSLDQELERARRSGSSLSVAMLDLDNFKQVNDTYGHACGDETLVSLARIMLTQTRRYDVAARLGGEEFAIILPGTGLIKARAMVERLLAALRDTDIVCPDSGRTLSVTCSAGLVTYKGMADSTPPDLLSLADKALYQAKAEGKDRVVTAPLQDVATPSRATLVESNEKKFLFTGS